jgi:hypothetical protein
MNVNFGAQKFNFPFIRGARDGTKCEKTQEIKPAIRTIGLYAPQHDDGAAID